ncbi:MULTISPECIES: YkgJ family cysteine cluster protein [Clostridium]|jgi:Fe-S-cluster containining protein|uniref:YkgJ family cysteine cluster protein n=1 Tax=Clostridium beijerinckii TaxID=1520 RepID=A0AAW3WFJ7_CLOBE|nr:MULTISPECIES: YkgJ family cysteine cluster protein [Clostridium]AVK46772.1 Fe-S-cluster oxidoreductase [Clostridium sp. MF28]MBC2460113.1 YkgJ family cysteine cluster protein [Clostridium beijerinckii]MBC2477607.1 YkgJ family cysteine cluster protein [Clostridium beijerinckii]MCI1580944.1 YkgJ family cysteine cluster protein [Clostridium beijerinckii]MCI1585886.1 YkgJ family cysteine cluster protein [Clostridium beijerinckii]
MKLLFDGEGKVNYDKIAKNTTVKDVLDAIDIFLNNNPLDCNGCEESCCKKSWSVEMDNVCVNKLSNWDNEAASNFVQERLVKKRNYYRDFDQYVLDKKTDCNFITETNLCTIYEERPVICRLYICSARSYRYNVIRELIGSTYLKALVLEEKIRKNDFPEQTIDKYKRNPAVFAKEYDILLEEIFDYAEDEGWLYSDERDELYEEIPLNL